jgi:hypothetical protein
MATIKGENMNRPELTYEEFCALPLTYTFGMSGDKFAIRQYMNTEHGICKETYTPLNALRHEWGKPTIVFYMPDDERTFDTPDQLYVAYMGKACGIEA